MRLSGGWWTRLPSVGPLVVVELVLRKLLDTIDRQMKSISDRSPGLAERRFTGLEVDL